LTIATERRRSMTDWEAKMLSNFSDAVEDAIARYLADKNMTDNALKEYFGDYKMYDRVKDYIAVIS
jgi:hypothetical protein